MTRVWHDESLALRLFDMTRWVTVFTMIWYETFSWIAKHGNGDTIQAQILKCMVSSQTKLKWIKCRGGNGDTINSIVWNVLELKYHDWFVHIYLPKGHSTRRLAEEEAEQGSVEVTSRKRKRRKTANFSITNHYQQATSRVADDVLGFIKSLQIVLKTEGDYY